MRTKGLLKDITDHAISVMRQDGLTEGYITGLSSTWNCLEQYLEERESALSLTTCEDFLKETYGIERGHRIVRLTGVNKRHRRAVFMLLNCLEHDTVRKPKSYERSVFNPLFEPVFSEFIAVRKGQSLSMSTINRDIDCLNKLSSYLEISGVSGVQDISSVHLIGFMKKMSEPGLLPTLKRIASSLRVLLRYLFQRGILPEDRSDTIPKVHCPTDGIPSMYNTDEVEAILNGIDRASPCGLRNYAMVLLAARLGMRASDICALKFENLDWQTNTIAFMSRKTGSYASLPLSGELGNAIIDYVRFGRPQTQDKHIFIRMQKPYSELLPSILHAIVTKSCHAVNIPLLAGKRHGPHALRTTLASRMLSKNVPLPVISEILTHASSDTTGVYLKIDREHLRACSLDVPPLGNVWMGGIPQ
jgi:site-specific recombinase XerD